MHLFSNMANSEIHEIGHNKIELVFNILLYSDKITHIQEWSRDIKTHSEVCVTPEYSEPWYIQDLKHIHNHVKYLQYSVLRKQYKFFFALFSNMANCYLCDTGRNKVELMFNIRKRDRFLEKSVFSWRKAACPQK